MTELIPILGAIMRTRKRKEKDVEKIDEWHKQSYNIDMPWENNTRRLLIWIDEFTTGRFYIDVQLVAFESAEDFTIFKLWYKE